MIMHLDLDAFFASAERISAPHLQGKPIAVGGRSDPFIFDKKAKSKKVSLENSGAFVPVLFNREKETTFSTFFQEKERIRGIIITCSYEARAYGIKTGMSIREALSRCPNLIVREPNHQHYHTLSHDLRSFLETKVPSLEQYSIDEFFADVSGWIEEDDIEYFAKKLKKEILKEFSLPISIGIAKSKWIAKLATHFAKPDGIYYVPASHLSTFIHDIPISLFPGIGKAYQKKLLHYQKKTLGDIEASKELLYSWGNSGKVLYQRVCGIDNERVAHKKDRKSIGISRTFDPIIERKELKRRLMILARHLIFLVLKLQLHPKTIFVSLRYQYHTSSKKQISINRVLSESFLQEKVQELFDTLDVYPYSPLIRITISLTNFQQNLPKQLSLFSFESDQKSRELSLQTQKIREKYGVDIIKRGREL